MTKGDKHEGQNPRSQGSYFWAAMGLALALHACLLVLWGFLEKSRGPKKMPLQVAVSFRKASPQHSLKERKQVVALPQEPDLKRPEKARFFTDSDHSAPQDQASRLTSLNPQNLSKSPEKKGAAAPKTFVQKPPKGLQGSLKKQASNDPLGILPTALGNSYRDSTPFADDLEDVKKGNKTELNAWQWLHAPFFNRVKSRVAQAWSPQNQIARHDPSGMMLGQQDRTTVMRVVIDRSGNLNSISVAESSGVAYLDDEAERAFRTAAPFPFPPKELFNEKGLFAFEFSFHLQFEHGLSFRFDWNPTS